MKHPFHTLFYIGFFTMVFIGGFLSLVIINLKEILPSKFSDNQKVVVTKDVIVPTPIKQLVTPTTQVKPIEKVIPKESSKTNTNPVVTVPKPIEQDTLQQKDSTVSPQTP